MDEYPISFQKITLSVLVGLIFFLIIFFQRGNDTRPKVVFCNVGQGDGIYIRTRDKQDIVIDTGPDGKMNDCLKKYMPFGDTIIEAVFISHPELDHIGGLAIIMDTYHINTLITTLLPHPTPLYSKILRKAEQKNIHLVQAFAGTVLTLGDTKSYFFSPQKLNIKFSNVRTNLNGLSQVFVFTEGQNRILFTGDATPNLLQSIVRQHKIYSFKNLLTGVSILKIPHHGSKNGLTYDFLKLADPSLSVISVGQNNRYGHPSKITLDLLKASKTKVNRTDLEGDVVILLAE